jgi:long-subunit fatty acid transport protein
MEESMNELMPGKSSSRGVKQMADANTINELTNKIELLKQTQRLSDTNTKILLAKASKFMNVSDTGKITGPSFFTAMINWKLIIQILIELICKYLDYSKTDKMLWESNKK